MQEWPKYDRPTMPNSSHNCIGCGNPLKTFHLLCDDCIDAIDALDLEAASVAANEPDYADLLRTRMDALDVAVQ
jgi:hypothetical protein